MTAPPAEPGRTKEQYGKDAENLVIHLPLGSIVRDATTGRPLWHGYHADDSFVICR
jgi:GTPase involved in cell partitioning and DNA repair